MPPTRAPCRSHSPQWSPQRNSRPSEWLCCAAWMAQRIAAAAPSKVATMPSPVADSRRPPNRRTSVRTSSSWRSSSASQRRSPSATAWRVESTTSANSTVVRTRVTCATPCGRGRGSTGASQTSTTSGSPVLPPMASMRCIQSNHRAAQEPEKNHLREPLPGRATSARKDSCVSSSRQSRSGLVRAGGGGVGVSSRRRERAVTEP